MDPELLTQAKSLDEAFEMARDALSLIHEMRDEDAAASQAKANAA